MFFVDLYGKFYYAVHFHILIYLLFYHIIYKLEQIETILVRITRKTGKFIYIYIYIYIYYF